MQLKTFHENYFNSIQTLRGIAALFVILEHIRFLNCGAFGVDIFFCISGFMIMFTTHKDTSHFLSKRLIRIIPLYYLMTFGTFLLLIIFPAMFEQTEATPIFLIKSLFFIPFDIGGGAIQPLMRIGWTVNCEMFFYLLFFISIQLSHKYRGLICSTLLLLIAFFSEISPMNFAPLTFYGSPVMLTFVLGILIYYLAWGIYNLNLKKPLPRVLFPVCLITVVTLFILLTVTRHHINILGFRRLLLWGLSSMVVTLCTFTAGLFIKFPTWSISLGNMSFSLYLIHYYPVMFLDRAVFDFSAPTPFSLAGVILCFIVCIVLAYLTWYLVEKRFTHWLRSTLHSL